MEFFAWYEVAAIIVGTFVVVVWLGAACMIRDERAEWRAFGSGYYKAAQDVANEDTQPGPAA